MTGRRADLEDVLAVDVHEAVNRMIARECAAEGHRPERVIYSADLSVALSAYCSCRAVLWTPQTITRESTS